MADTSIARRIDNGVNRAIETYVAAIGGPNHRAAAESLDDELERLTTEAETGIVELGCIALMIGGHYRDGVWFLEHPKAPAPIPCENIAHMVEKYLSIIEHFGVAAPTPETNNG